MAGETVPLAPNQLTVGVCNFALPLLELAAAAFFANGRLPMNGVTDIVNSQKIIRGSKIIRGVVCFRNAGIGFNKW